MSVPIRLAQVSTVTLKPESTSCLIKLGRGGSGAMLKRCEAEDLGSVHWLSVDFKYPLAVPAWEGLGRCGSG